MGPHVRKYRVLMIFGAAFAIAEAYKFTHGDSSWGAIDLVLAILLSVVCFIAGRVTAPSDEDAPRGRLLPLQLAACTMLVLATLLGLGWVPGWNDGLLLGVNNFALYCIPITVLLLLLGVPLRSMGLGRFRKGSGWVAFALLVVPLGIFAWFTAIGKLSLGLVVQTWLINALQNGFSEEYMWRGAILGRLRTLMSTDLAILVQALAFGAWHYRSDMAGYHGNVVAAIGDMIASQAMFGLAMGYLRMRTGNVALPSAFHLLFDSMQLLQ